MRRVSGGILENSGESQAKIEKRRDSEVIQGGVVGAPVGRPGSSAGWQTTGSRGVGPREVTQIDS